MQNLDTITIDNVKNLVRDNEKRFSSDFKKLVDNISYINGTNTAFAGFILVNYTLLYLGNAKDVAANLVNDYVLKEITRELPNEFDTLTAWQQMSLLSIKLELQLFLKEQHNATEYEKKIVKSLLEGMSHIN